MDKKDRDALRQLAEKVLGKHYTEDEEGYETTYSVEAMYAVPRLIDALDAAEERIRELSRDPLAKAFSEHLKDAREGRSYFAKLFGVEEASGEVEEKK